MRARVVDPKGPLWTRSLLPLLAAVCLVLPITVEQPPRGPLFLLGTCLLALAPMLIGRRRDRDVELELGAGHVDVKRAGTLSQRIRGRKVTGASTAHLAKGFAVTLQHKGRPITLEVDTEADVEAIRAALGINHHGFGRIEWVVRPDDADKTNRVARLMIGVSAALGALAVMLGGGGGTEALAIFGFLGGFIGLFLAFIALIARLGTRAQPRIVLESRGVVLDGVPYNEVPYSAIAEARDAGDAVVIVLRSGHTIAVPTSAWRLGWHRGLTDREREDVVSQINSAAGRAIGLGPPRPEVGFQVEELARKGEQPRGWLARLDAAADRIRVEGGYRGASIPQEDLWAALENHDAPAEVRAAAARLLARSDRDPAAGKRIEQIAASARDQKTEKRIRIALQPDLEEAARELEALEEEEEDGKEKRVAGGSSR